MYTKQGSINDENFLYLSSKIDDLENDISESTKNINFNFSDIADEMKSESVGNSFIELIKVVAGNHNIDYKYFDNYSDMVNYFSEMKEGKLIFVRMLSSVVSQWSGYSSNMYGLLCKYIYEESFDDDNLHYTIEYPSILFLGFTSSTMIVFRWKIGSTNLAQYARTILFEISL